MQQQFKVLESSLRTVLDEAPALLHHEELSPCLKMALLNSLRNDLADLLNRIANLSGQSPETHTNIFREASRFCLQVSDLNKPSQGMWRMEHGGYGGF
jgi:hypothetical protein